MKSTGHTDAEIAKYLGISLVDFLEAIESDYYLSEVYKQASEKLASEIEAKFLENVMNQLEAGDNTDAKWILERTSNKYSKKDKLELTVRSIDDIIKENSV
jgi:hypothetical protein